MTKSILAIHDIACVGKCSLSVVLPTISACGVTVCPLPIALLSNHTAFSDFGFCDLTANLPVIIEKFKKLKFAFSAIYAGYLGNEELINQLVELHAQYESAKLYLDPVMGDNGKLYSNFAIDYPTKILKLVKRATIIFPNLTEACLMLNIAYKESFTPQEITEILVRLANLGPKQVVLTGVKYEKEIWAYAYDSETKMTYSASTPYINEVFYGTGDIFASVLIGKMETGSSLEEALKIAINFCYKVVEETKKVGIDSKLGVCFEKFLGELGEKRYE